MVRSALTTLVVDSTPDFRYQMLRENVKHLDAIVFTHPHKDHIAGLDDVRAYNFFTRRPMEIYANEMTQEGVGSAASILHTHQPPVGQACRYQ